MEDTLRRVEKKLDVMLRLAKSEDLVHFQSQVNLATSHPGAGWDICPLCNTRYVEHPGTGLRSCNC